MKESPFVFAKLSERSRGHADDNRRQQTTKTESNISWKKSTKTEINDNRRERKPKPISRSLFQSNQYHLPGTPLYCLFRKILSLPEKSSVMFHHFHSVTVTIIAVDYYESYKSHKIYLESTSHYGLSIFLYNIRQNVNDFVLLLFRVFFPSKKYTEGLYIKDTFTPKLKKITIA